MSNVWFTSDLHLGHETVAVERAEAYGAPAVAAHPHLAVRCPNPVGPGNIAELAAAACLEPVTMLAWGSRAPRPRARGAAQLLWWRTEIHGTRLAVLGWTKQHQPGHPLYVRIDEEPKYVTHKDLALIGGPA